MRKSQPSLSSTPASAPTPQDLVATAQGIPPVAEDRHNLRILAQQLVADQQLRPPLSLEELREHGRQICLTAGLPEAYYDFATLMVSNALWRDIVAAVPYERRILLLPQCLRSAEACPAEMDELGLLCRQCGRCRIGLLQARAEKLGYVVLIAEGTTVVTQLLQQGKVDAVIGVSCLPVLERAFPHMAAQAIPGLALLLLKDGCKDTELDQQWLLQMLEERSASVAAPTFDFEATRALIRRWFAPEALRAQLGVPMTRTEELAQSWLTRAGKRWRPFLTVCAYQALGGTNPESVRSIAMAVECFHKASLIHDDIEDNDDSRYDAETLHREHGIPVALNTGDLLLGDGYRLIADSNLPPERITVLLQSASAAHRALCLGQGEELLWSRAPEAITVAALLDIFRLKTAPAFAVALEMGATCAGVTAEIFPVLRAFSDALGICYQIRDDLEDLTEQHLPGMAPSILLAIAFEQTSSAATLFLRKLSAAAKNSDGTNQTGLAAEWQALLHECDAEARARQLLRHYRHEAIRALEGVPSAALQNLLRRTVVWILGE